jgi:hypothetical protein
MNDFKFDARMARIGGIAMGLSDTEAERAWALLAKGEAEHEIALRIVNDRASKAQFAWDGWN